MGRKPNPLVIEYFERGPKLEDASNRYQHTCKSCGEKFPKGRIDSLTAHLTKKCPAISVNDRRRALLALHELPDLPENLPVPGSMQHELQNARNGNQNQNGQTLELPYGAPKPGMSALETLAEVSRQHLDLSGKRPKTPGQGGRRLSSNTRDTGNHYVPQTSFSADDFLVSDDKPGDENGREYWNNQGIMYPATNQTITTPVPTQGDVSSGPALPSIYQFPGMPHSPSSSPHLPGLSLPQSQAPTATMVPSPLQAAASAANQELQSMMPNANMTMEPNLEVSNQGMTDKYFHPQGRQASAWPNMLDPLLQGNSNEQQQGQEVFQNRPASTYPRPIAMNPTTQTAHFTTDFSMNQKPGKPKVRGRFSDTRRKEVQEVRKRGACIRCRMLKKPCSGESPCSTCQNVESARLWKQPCIRTRIAEEFNLYSAGLHGVIAFHAVNHAKAQVKFEQIPGRIEATHFPESSVFATFTISKGQRAATPAIDPTLLGLNGPMPEPLSDLEIIDADTDDLCGKLELYMRRLASTFYEAETSTFMKPTLTQAFNMSANNRDGLLTRVLELWVATQILVLPNIPWTLFVNPSLPPSMTPAFLSPGDMDSNMNPHLGQRIPITPDSHPDSHRLIVAQLRGSIEKRAANIAKTVMNDIERRLLQRQQANPFETFLVSVILLSCVERMCWLFKTWEGRPSRLTQINQEARMQAQEQAQQAQQNLDPDLHQIQMHLNDEALAAASRAAAMAAVNANNSTDQNQSANMPQQLGEDLGQTDRSVTPHTDPHQQSQYHQYSQPNPLSNALYPENTTWPLDRSPPHFSQQGERFSDILHMLLKMRGVPPKIAPDPATGILQVADDVSHAPGQIPSPTAVQASQEANAEARRWFEAVGVTQGWIEERKARAERVGNRDEGPSDWEGVYVGKILGAGIVG